MAQWTSTSDWWDGVVAEMDRRAPGMLPMADLDDLRFQMSLDPTPPWEAFGEPANFVDFMVAMELSTTDGVVRLAVLDDVHMRGLGFIQLFSGFVGVFATLDLVYAFLVHQPLLFSWGDAVSVVILFFAARLYSSLFADPGDAHVSAASGVRLVGFLLVFVTSMFIEPISTLSWWQGLYVAVPALAVSVLASWLQRRLLRGSVPVVPLPAVQEEERVGLLRRLVVSKQSVDWVFVLAALGGASLLWLLADRAGV